MIILPADPKRDDSIRFRNALQDVNGSVPLVLKQEGHDALHNLVHSLMELRLAGIAKNKPRHKILHFVRTGNTGLGRHEDGSFLVG
jgi:hypothetical protein